MQGFFKRSQVETAPRASRIQQCGACRLNKGCISPNMPATGSGDFPLLVIAEAPGAREDEENTQLIGACGQFLRQALTQRGIDLDACRKINAVNCRPPDNRTPTPIEILACRPKVIHEIRTFKPRVILLLGASPLSQYLNGKWFKEVGSMEKWRGWAIPDREYSAWVCPTYHPSYIQRMKKEKGGEVMEVIWGRDLDNAIAMMDVAFPELTDIPSQIRTERCENDKGKKLVIDFLDGMTARPRLTAVDFETSSLKPQEKGQFIHTCAVSDGKRTLAFRMVPEIVPALVRYLINPQIPKIASNFKFEDNWARRILGVIIRGWFWDTMLAAHVLDNRRGITGLKFQAFVNFGIGDYDKSVAPFLESSRKGGNNQNRILKADLDEVLLYDGMDARLEYDLCVKQCQQMGVEI